MRIMVITPTTGFKIVVKDKSGNTTQAIHQLFINYLAYEWLHKVVFFSRFNFFKKIIRQLVVPCLNALYLLFEPIWPKSEKLYLNNIILAEKL